jgi:hypothetical protein
MIHFSNRTLMQIFSLSFFLFFWILGQMMRVPDYERTVHLEIMLWMTTPVLPELITLVMFLSIM